MAGTSTAATFFDRHRALFEYDTYGRGDGATPTSTAGFVAAMQALLSTSGTSSYDYLLAHAHLAPPDSTKYNPMMQPLLTSAPQMHSAPILAPPSFPLQRYTNAQPITAVHLPPPLAPVGQAPHWSPATNNVAATAHNNHAPFSPAQAPQLSPRPHDGPAPFASISSGPTSHPQPQGHPPQQPHQTTSSHSHQTKTPLLDSSQRVARGRKIELAQKIEQLVGPKFGRVVGTSNQNLPPSIKRRLDAYHRLDERKEALYQLLKAEHVALQGCRRR